MRSSSAHRTPDFQALFESAPGLCLVLPLAEQANLRTHAELLLRKQQPWQEELIHQLRRVLPQAPPEGL